MFTTGTSTRHRVKQPIFIAGFTPDKKATLVKVAATEWGAELFSASTIIPLPLLAIAPDRLIDIESIATK